MLTARLCFSIAIVSSVGAVGLAIEVWRRGIRCVLFGHDYQPKGFKAEGQPYYDVDPWMICSRCKDWRRESDESTGGGLRVRDLALASPGAGWPEGQ